MNRGRSSFADEKELVNVSFINQYLYCSRRYWYIHFYDTIGENYPFVDGIKTHERKSKRGGWTEEIYLEDIEIGLKGKIDILEEDQLVPVERKRGSRFFENDVMQVAGYCYLLDKCSGETVKNGIIYLYGNDERVRIPFDRIKRKRITDIVSSMHELSLKSPPPYAENPNKCTKCSTRKYCMPKESRMLGETNEQLE